MTHMTTIEELQHHTAHLKGGGKIVVIDSGAVLNAEMTSMLQALHSRSTGGIDAHLEVLAKRGAEGFMKTYYVGYGHKSIGDCGMAVVFIEGVSMLAAKAIQDSPLYNGQEASTRYIPFDRQPFIDPLNTKASEVILENWRQFYLKSVTEMKIEIKRRHPFNPDDYPLNKDGSEKSEGKKKEIWENASNARAFDVTRGFLPAGVSTNLAWTTTLRQFADRITILRHHPLEEVREIAEQLEDAMIATHPNSFSKKRYPETEGYLGGTAQDCYYYHDPKSPEMELVHDGINAKGIMSDSRYQKLMASRPAKIELPKWLGVYGVATLAFTLDFGSFRDVQRHRAVMQRMPLLTTDLGFHEWYLGELTESLQDEAIAFIASQKVATDALAADAPVLQYYLPMGYKISNYLTGDLPALTYLIEIRATSMVHPTLAFQAEKMAHILEARYGHLGLQIRLGSVAGKFDIGRGEATITKVN
jgi:thymidylate synthase ThyX